ncbi:hypothetical protein ACL1HT_00780 [Corynebacterium striatum]|nr:hypothetical protein [Corynebacterium striatum]HAT1264773.1 hypothetical protein [Corynebacterium striatum]HAT1415670.1 hypothetical protein [Corynebacterium striatum]HAT1425749.1 hypothetical protein [Corynebacterium striatum]HAT1430849.1 hypothetical protein [Corynebacterium striatum]
MSKWKVMGGRLRGSTFWEVFNHNGRFMESFTTHAEALAYADRQARTREVVLPRVNGFTPIDENDLDITVFDVAGSVCISQPQLGRSGKEQIITIHTESAAEVALALLAHAERIEK